MKISFVGLISTLDTAEEIISDIYNMIIETSKTEKQRQSKPKKNNNKRTGYLRTLGQLQKM